MKNKLVMTLALILSAFVLAVTIRGVVGDPAPQVIYEKLRDPGKPFELSPERGRYALLTSIADNKSVFFTQDIAEYVVPDLGLVNGNYVSLFAPGVSVVALPLFILGKMINLEQFLSFSTSSLFAVLNVLLITLLVKKYTKNVFAGVAAGLTFLFATSSWSYAVTLYQHHISAFLLLATLYLLTYQVNWLRMFLVGVLYGLGIFIDYPNAMFMLPLAIYAITKNISVEEQDSKVSVVVKYSILTLAIGFVLSLIPTFAYNKLAYGNPLQLAGTVQNVRSIQKDPITGELMPLTATSSNRSAAKFFSIDKLPNSMSVILTSKDRGMLWFNPVILLGLLGMAQILKKDRNYALTLFASILAVFTLYGMWGDPWGGWAFGPRYMIPAMAMLAVLLGFAINKYSKKFLFGAAYIVLTGYGLFINMIGALTTNQIPTSVEAIDLNYPTLTYFHNLELAQKGYTGSFVYNNFISKYIPLNIFILAIFVVIYLFILVNFTKSRRSGGLA